MQIPLNLTNDNSTPAIIAGVGKSGVNNTIPSGKPHQLYPAFAVVRAKEDRAPAYTQIAINSATSGTSFAITTRTSATCLSHMTRGGGHFPTTAFIVIYGKTSSY